MTQIINPWLGVVSLHPDVLSEEFSEDIFALDLDPLADGNPNVAAVYRDPEHFFRASYLTTGLKSLLKDVLSRLGGGAIPPAVAHKAMVRLRPGTWSSPAGCGPRSGSGRPAMKQRTARRSYGGPLTLHGVP